MEHFYNNFNTGMFTYPQLYTNAVADCPPGGVLVEIGSWVGTSLAYLVVEATNANKNLQVFCVDSFSGDMFTSNAGAFPQWDTFKKNLEPIWDKFSIVKAPSVPGADHFKDGSVNFVFIDADHSLEAVRADIKAWWPKVAPGGTFAGHDFHHPPVRQAVDEFIAETGAACRIGEDCWWIIK